MGSPIERIMQAVSQAQLPTAAFGLQDHSSTVARCRAQRVRQLFRACARKETLQARCPSLPAHGI